MSQPNDLKRYMQVALPKQRYYTNAEVAMHNTANDCWLVLFGEVYDVTRLIQENIESELTRPFIEAAGTDVTYWFDQTSREPRVHVDIESGHRKFYCPLGKYLHLEDSQLVVKWWKDSSFIIGRLTKKSRQVRLQNMITDHVTQLQVPSEETINEILTRYLKFNKHGGSYAWKRLGRPLDMTKTLSENGVEDQDTEFEHLEVENSVWYVPTIHLFFNDDLTVA